MHKGKQDLKNGSSTLLEKSLLALFLVKPVIDLFWGQYFTVGGKALSPLHITGFLIFIYFGILRLSYPQYTAPYASVFRLFIIVNLLSAVTSIFFVDSPQYLKVVDILLRLLDSYLIFNIAYILGMTKQYESYVPFIRAIFIGAAIAAIVNVVAIVMGFGAHLSADVVGATLARQQGIYSDPGVLGNAGLYGFIFAIVLFDIAPKKSLLLKLFCIGISPVFLYLIFISLSRINLVLVFVFGLLYVSIYKKSIGSKLTAVIFAISIIVFGSAVLNLDYGSVAARFGSEISVLSAEEQEYASTSEGRVSFGKYEQLGNNRVMLWAIALDHILHRDVLELMIGNFYKSAPSHSDYFDVMFRTGIIGLILYLLLLFLIEIRLFRLAMSQGDKKYQYVYFLGFALMTAHILCAFPFRPLSYTTTAWYMWTMLGFALARMKVRKLNPVESRIKNEKPRARLIPARLFRAPVALSRRK